MSLVWAQCRPPPRGGGGATSRLLPLSHAARDSSPSGGARLEFKSASGVLEGYAAPFGVADLAGDIVRAGAFRASLKRRGEPLPMLAQHEPRLLAGYWTETREDARGLYVRGETRPDLPGAERVRRMLARGADGLSIGFIPIVAHKTREGRVLEEIELLEVSIVTLPMQPLARLIWAQTRLYA